MFSFFDSLFQVNTDIYFVEKNNSFLLLGKNRKTVFELKDVSFIIWKNLQKPISFTDLLAKLQEEYDVEREELIKDIESWLKEALKEKIIKKIKTKQF